MIRFNLFLGIACCILLTAAAPPAPRTIPEFWAYNAGGEAVHLGDRTPRGKWVLVEFHTTGGKQGRNDRQVMADLREKYLTEDRLLLLSVCADLDFGDWIEHVSRQTDLSDGKGGTVRPYSDRRWWQLSLGVRREKDRADFVKAHDLGTKPAYYLVRPGGALEAAKIPPEKLNEALARALGRKGFGG